jgi:CRISPR-associated protein Csy2
MSTFITLHKIQIQNANCVAGLTYGFPAITHFLGYIHALSRNLENSHQLKLHGCAVVCHQHQIHTYQPKGFGEYVLAQTRNPLTRTGEVAPIMQEGKMHLTVSLVTRCEGIIGGDESVKIFKDYLQDLCCTQKLAGGTLNHLKNIFIDTCNTEEDEKQFHWLTARRLLPGFVLINQPTYLEQQFYELKQIDSDATLLDAWADFFTLKYKAEPWLKEGEQLSDKTEAGWEYVAKPQPGYLVPLLVGYKAISEEFEPGSMHGVRDSGVPFSFVEAAYGIGEWVSPHRVNIDNAMWYYQNKPGWFLCDHMDPVESYLENDNEEYSFLYGENHD